MPDTKITALTAIGANPIIPSTFPIPMVDLTDTSMAASGTTKKVTVNQILGAGGTATLASATISGDLTVDTNTLKVDSANNRVGVGTASPAVTCDVAGPIRSIVSGGTPYLYLNNGTSQHSLSNDSNALSISVFAAEQMRIAASGVFTWYDGAGGTRMTLNATGLGVGNAPVAALDVYKVANDTINRTNATFCFGQITGLGAALLGQQSASAPYQFNLQAANAANSVQFPLVLQPSGGNVGIGVAPITSHILSCSGPVGITGTLAGTRTSYITNASAASIYYTDGGGSGYFTDFGNLIIQPRTSAARSVVIATGSTTPVERAVVKSTGQVRFVPLAADPAGAESGDVYYNSTSNKLKCYNGTTWNDLF